MKFPNPMSKPFRVYLAGPIGGLDYDSATNWREKAQELLYPIRGMSPMRGKEYLKHLTDIPETSEAFNEMNNVMSSARGIMTRDRYDCTTCDVLLVNLLGAKKVSIGTMIEIGWADAHRIPIIAVMEKGNVHEHGMVDEAIGYRVSTLEEAVYLTRMLLLGE